MKYPEEDLANDLHRALTREFASTSTAVSICGAGVHWHCTAERDDSHCKINCFGSLGAEYYTSFNRCSVELATSRIPSRDNTIAAVRCWLDGHDVAHLCDRYQFIDREKRALMALRDEVIAYEPALRANAESELKHQFGDFYNLHFRADDRSCEISFYGKHQLPDAKFSWHDCQLFKYQPEDSMALSSVLKRWVCDTAMPSQMRIDFPWLHIEGLADYFECGRPIEGEFIQSWDFIEEFYTEDWCTFSNSVLSMIHDMRKAGFDRCLRAGQSMSSLGLSRSRRHGLRNGQPCLWFDFRDATMNVHAEFASTQLEQHPIQLTQDVRQLLDVLVETEID